MISWFASSSFFYLPMQMIVMTSHNCPRTAVSSSDSSSAMEARSLTGLELRTSYDRTLSVDTSSVIL